MCRCYWERWQWELVQRKEQLQKTRIRTTTVSRLYQIDVSLLKDPVQGTATGTYVVSRARPNQKERSGATHYSSLLQEAVSKLHHHHDAIIRSRLPRLHCIRPVLH